MKKPAQAGFFIARSSHRYFHLPPGFRHLAVISDPSPPVIGNSSAYLDVIAGEQYLPLKHQKVVQGPDETFECAISRYGMPPVGLCGCALPSV